MPTIRLPETLTARQRAWIHAAAEKAGIPHQSTTTAAGDRMLLLGDAATAPSETLSSGEVVDVALPDTSNDSIRAAVVGCFPLLDALLQDQAGRMGMGGGGETVQAAVERFEELLRLEQHAEIQEVLWMCCSVGVVFCGHGVCGGVVTSCFHMHMITHHTHWITTNMMPHAPTPHHIHPQPTTCNHTERACTAARCNHQWRVV